MSILYCTISHFAIALTQRDRSDLDEHPLVLVDPEGRVFDASPEATACGVIAGLTARVAQIRCPQACFIEADVAYYWKELETLFEVLERTGPQVEPHGWGAAYVDLGDLARNCTDARALCSEMGRAIRRALGKSLQPALGWNSGKFTAQAAAHCTRPGHLLAVSAARERAFLDPLPVTLLPLNQDAQRRLGFLGLRVLKQYAALPPAAVWQQFGRAGKLAQRFARGQDDRSVVSRHQAPRLSTEVEFEAPLVERERLLAALNRLVSPMLGDLREGLRACGQLGLAVRYGNGHIEERTRAFILPTADESTIVRALEQLVDKMSWPASATALSVTLEQIQDVVIEQLTLFPADGPQRVGYPRGSERERKLCEVQRYLAARFGANCLRRAALVHPRAPLPEWRVGWAEWDTEGNA
jgi:nucleotidyltransferase/DNA polymerase involved in DNA repair